MNTRPSNRRSFFGSRARSGSRRRRTRLVAGTAAGALLVAGVVTAATVAASAGSDSGTAESGAAEKTSVAGEEALPRVTDARTARHDRFDRLVLDIVGEAPKVEVDRVPALHQDGSGDPVDLDGEHFLQIRLTMATAHDDEGRSVYHGPRQKAVDLPRIKGVALVGDFEGQVTFGLAFDKKPSYTVDTLHDPERIVVDVRH